MIFPLFVIPERFERSTHALEGRCSIQLSYGTNLDALKFLLKAQGYPFAGAKIVRLFGSTKKKVLFLLK